jgi:subtilisin family serine protease
MSHLVDEEIAALGATSVIVVLKQSAPKRSGAMASAAAATTVDPNELRKYFSRQPTSQRSQLAASMRSASGSKKTATAPVSQYYPNLGVMFGTVDRKGLNGLRADTKRVAQVLGAPKFSLIRPAKVAAAEPTEAVTWGIQALGIPALWDDGFVGKGVRVGHLDTGVDGEHPSLEDAIAAFAEFDELGRRVDPTPPAHDTDEHGTHTAGTIAGRPFAGMHFGAAPGAQLVSAIVIEGGQVIARILGGMDWALGEGVRILNMSLGLRGVHDDFIPLTQILRSKNVLPVFAVGNEGAGTSRAPGNYAEALSVGACNEDLAIADFSSSQRFLREEDPIVPDLVGPGVDIISTKPGGDFQSMDGTSMATPHIAGLAAVLMEAKPEASAAKVEAAIFKSCKRPAGAPRARGGRGLPNARKALAAL